MAIQGIYEPSPRDWVRDQVEAYESSGGTRGNTLLDTGLPVIIVATRGAKSNKIRKTPLMKVVEGDNYVLVASQGGLPTHPQWYFNIIANPDEVMIQDGPEPFSVSIRKVEGAERKRWLEKAEAAFPPYVEYQQKTDREIPVFVATRK